MVGGRVVMDTPSATAVPPPMRMRRQPRTQRLVPRRRLLGPDPLLVSLVVALGTVGAFTIYAAAYGLNGTVSARSYLLKDLLNLAIGLVLSVLVAAVDYRRLRFYGPVGYVAVLVALLAVLSPLGTTVNGAHAWFTFGGGFQLEPSEFAKPVVIVLLAAILSRRHAAASRPGWRDVLLALGLAALPLLLIAAEPALGISIVLALVIMVALSVAGVHRAWLIGLALVTVLGAGAVFQLHLLKPYQQARFTSFLHPQNGTSGVAYQTQQSITAIGAGGLTGEGFLRGSQTNGRFVPEQQTDFAFTVVAEETGMAGSATVLALLCGLSLRALGIARGATDRFGSVIAAGVGCWFAAQTFINVGMTLGLMPVTGIPLPFVSYGGSAMFCNLIGVGLVLSVARGSGSARGPHMVSVFARSPAGPS